MVYINVLTSYTCSGKKKNMETIHYLLNTHSSNTPLHFHNRGFRDDDWFQYGFQTWRIKNRYFPSDMTFIQSNTYNKGIRMCKILTDLQNTIKTYKCMNAEQSNVDPPISCLMQSFHFFSRYKNGINLVFVAGSVERIHASILSMQIQK